MNTTKTYYEILGVSRTACRKTIRSSYLHLVKKHHPDFEVNTDHKKLAEEKFKKISEAYSVLFDESKRSDYDRSMRTSSSTPSSSSYSSEAFRNAQYNRKYHGSDQFWSQQYQKKNHSNYTSKTSYYYNDGSDKSNQNPEYEEYSNPRSHMKNIKEKMANGILWRHVLLFALCAFYVKKFIFRETGDKTDDIVAEKNPGYLSYKKPAKLPSRVTTNREEFLENRKKMKSY